MRNILKTFLIQLGLFTVLLAAFGVVYAAWDDVVSSGDPINSANWNSLINELKDVRDNSGGIPSGSIMAFNLASCPAGWSIANGTGGTPDLRGEFIRGLDLGRGVDSGRVLASTQGDAFESHNHNFTRFNGDDSTGGASGAQGGDWNSSLVIPNGFSTSSVGGTETRPRNIALLYCIKN